MRELPAHIRRGQQGISRLQVLDLALDLSNEHHAEHLVEIRGKRPASSGLLRAVLCGSYSSGEALAVVVLGSADKFLSYARVLSHYREANSAAFIRI